jgi:hypothetical protein
MFADFVDLHDVRMLQSGDGLGLEAEAFELLRVRMRTGQNHLKRDQALEVHLPGSVHNAHAAAA